MARALLLEVCATETETRIRRQRGFEAAEGALRANHRMEGAVCAALPDRPGEPAGEPRERGREPLALDQLHEQADALFGEMPDGVMIQHDGRIVYANREMAALLGLPDARSLLGTVALELYPESAFPAVVSRMQSVYFGRPSPVSRHPVRRADGGCRELEVSSLLIRLAGALMLIEIHRSPKPARPDREPSRRSGTGRPGPARAGSTSSRTSRRG